MRFEGTSSRWSQVHKDNVPEGKFYSCTVNAVSFDSLGLAIEVKDSKYLMSNCLVVDCG